jgi:hypothetical protein
MHYKMLPGDVVAMIKTWQCFALDRPSRLVLLSYLAIPYLFADSIIKVVTLGHPF